jgi:predicted nucleotidyltransferase
MSCIKQVVDRLDAIKSALSKATAKCQVTPSKVYLWKSRARGNCRQDSDIDLYVSISDMEASKVDLNDLDMLNRALRELDVMRVDGLRLDARFGKGLPGKPPFINLEEVQNLV